MIPTFERVDGPYGAAEPVPVPAIPLAAETVCTWLITSPIWHPLWSQYTLCVVRLRDGVPGFPPPIRKFAGATHELLVVALNPEQGTQTVASVDAHQFDGRLPFLTPVNIAEQYIATDPEMLDLASLCAQGVTHGALCPETADAPERIRGSWLIATTKTLAHIRGEAHAS